MSQIKGKNTKPEMLVRKFLHGKGFRYKLHDKKLLGKPDIVLPKYKIIIEVYGCFWHGHENCKYFTLPKTNVDWWKNKIYTNVKKGIANRNELIQQGWEVIIVWECELKNGKLETTFKSLLEKLCYG